jgi:CHAD domain-containing protein
MSDNHRPLEEERKFEVAPGFTVPDLSPALPSDVRVVPVPTVPLHATYFDTDDLRLARSGASLRYRTGDAQPWTAKLPTEVPGIRLEVSRPAGSGRDEPPEELVALLTRYTRGRPVRPGVLLRTERTVYELRDAADRLLAEVDDDTVAVLDGERVTRTFREIEVERHAGGRKLLTAVARALVAAGARAPESFTAKHVRALGELPPPDFPGVPPLPAKPTAGAVVTAALRADIGRILEHDPLVRLRLPLPDGDTAVHQMRVGCRRLRSDLKTYRALLDKRWAGELREALRPLADALGAVRDAEVLRDRLRRTAAPQDPAPQETVAVDEAALDEAGLDDAALDQVALDEAALARLDEALAQRYDTALAELDAALRGPGYHELLDRLVAAAQTPQLTPTADRKAAKVLPRLAGRPWHDLVLGRDGLSGAGDLSVDAPDEAWHEVRIRAKRARYAVDATVPVLGSKAKKLAKAIGTVQDRLGEHQDAAVAAQTWLELARQAPDDERLAETAGRLAQRERSAIRAVRQGFPAVWARAAEPGLSGWLP